MAYFLGRDVKVAVVCESTGHGFTNSGGTTVAATTGSSDARCKGRTGTPLATNPLADITGVDLTLGTVDEDIAYLGQRTALKAEIKKETTISLTLKKTDNFWSSMWAQGFRWGTNSTTEHTGLENVVAGANVATWGYRVAVMGKTGEEIINLAGCTFTNYSTTLNADGVTEETVEFMTQVTPNITNGSDMEVSTALGASPYFV